MSERLRYDLHRDHRNRRGPAARGYGGVHQRIRARLAPAVATGEVACARCGRLIQPGDDWDFGHSDRDKTRYRGPEHAGCNRSAGAQQRNRSEDPEPDVRAWW